MIEAAYRRLARKWHPDTSSEPAAAERIRELNAAYEVLSDPDRRRAYDAQRLVTGVVGEGGLPSWAAPVGAGLVGLLLIGRLGRLGVLLLVALAALYWWTRVARR